MRFAFGVSNGSIVLPDGCTLWMPPDSAPGRARREDAVRSGINAWAAVGQPWIELGYCLHDGQGTLREVGLTFGMWHSVHDGATDGAGSIWYESDIYARLSGKLGERLSVATTYTVYHSPNGAFGTVEEQVLTGGFDDQQMLLDGGLQPSVTFAFELDGQADAGSRIGTYAQLARRPRCRACPASWARGRWHSDCTSSCSATATSSAMLGDAQERIVSLGLSTTF